MFYNTYDSYWLWFCESFYVILYLIKSKKIVESKQKSENEIFMEVI